MGGCFGISHLQTLWNMYRIKQGKNKFAIFSLLITFLSSSDRRGRAADVETDQQADADPERRERLHLSPQELQPAGRQPVRLRHLQPAVQQRGLPHQRSGGTHSTWGLKDYFTCKITISITHPVLTGTFDHLECILRALICFLSIFTYLKLW